MTVARPSTLTYMLNCISATYYYLTFFNLPRPAATATATAATAATATA